MQHSCFGWRQISFVVGGYGTWGLRWMLLLLLLLLFFNSLLLLYKHNDNNYNEVHELYIQTHIYNEMR